MLVSALASHGQMTDALNLYEEMKQAGSNLEPKAVISLIVRFLCIHALCPLLWTKMRFFLRFYLFRSTLILKENKADCLNYWKNWMIIIIGWMAVSELSYIVFAIRI